MKGKIRSKGKYAWHKEDKQGASCMLMMMTMMVMMKAQRGRGAESRPSKARLAIYNGSVRVTRERGDIKVLGLGQRRELDRRTMG